MHHLSYHEYVLKLLGSRMFQDGLLKPFLDRRFFVLQRRVGCPTTSINERVKISFSVNIF